VGWRGKGGLAAGSEGRGVSKGARGVRGGRGGGLTAQKERERYVASDRSLVAVT